MREGVLRQLQRYWKREMVMPSKEAIVGCTALRSMTRLVCSQGCDVSDRQRYAFPLQDAYGASANVASTIEAQASHWGWQAHQVLLSTMINAYVLQCACSGTREDWLL